MNKISLKVVFFLVFLLNFGLNAFAQNSECKDKVIVFEEFAKTNNFNDSTYEPWLELKKKCAKSEELLFIIGEKILKQKVDKANASEAKNLLVTELASLYDEHDKNFPNNNKGNKLNKALLLYENKVGSEEEIYSFLDKAFKTEYTQFTSPFALDLYSELTLKNTKEGEKVSPEDILSKMDLISEKVQIESKAIENVFESLTLKSKTESLSSDEKSKLGSAKIGLDQLVIVSENISGRLNTISTCENLTAYYEKNFDKNKDNALWLERASKKLLEKKCKSDLYNKIATQFYAVSPSSESAYNMAIASRNAKDNKQAAAYFEKAAESQANLGKKADYYYTAASTYGNTNKVKAKELALKALELNPSMGKAYTFIAQLYANSTNDCGENAFESKALYWLAAESAKKAGVVEPKLKKSADDLAATFMKRAPSKKEISEAKKKAGQSITFKCWTNESVSIPKL